MTNLDIFKMHVEYDPQKKYNWLFAINRQDNMEGLLNGFLRDMNDIEYEDYTDELSAKIGVQCECTCTVAGMIYCDATKEHFERFFAPLIDRGLVPEEFETVLVHFWDEGENIKVTGKRL